MPPVTDLEGLPAPLAFVGGVLFLAIWFARSLTALVKEWNDDARVEVVKEREARAGAEAELNTAREQIVQQVRESHEGRMRGIRREQQLHQLLTQHGIPVPDEEP